MKRLFSLTFETVTDESAERGDFEEHGLVNPNPVTLREALSLLSDTTDGHSLGIESIECDQWPLRDIRWVSVHHSPDRYTGVQETRSIHLPCTIKPSSKRRIARLIGAHGA